MTNLWQQLYLACAPINILVLLKKTFSIWNLVWDPVNPWNYIATTMTNQHPWILFCSLFSLTFGPKKDGYFAGGGSYNKWVLFVIIYSSTSNFNPTASPSFVNLIPLFNTDPIRRPSRPGFKGPKNEILTIIYWVPRNTKCDAKSHWFHGRAKVSGI